MTNPIAAEALRAGQQILLQGTLTFGKLAEQYTGEALERRIAQQTSNGSYYPTKVPHTTVNIADAKVLFHDPANPTLEEQFVQSKLYTIKAGDNQGKIGFGIDDKSRNLPPVFQKNAEGKFEQVKLERELASGLDVMLVVETYAPKDYAKKGLGLRQVLVNEEIRYFGGGASVEALAERGIVFAAPIEQVPATAGASAPAGGGAYEGEALPANTQIDPNSGLAMPSPGIPAPAVAAAPVATTTVAPIPVPAPAAAPVPVEDKDAEIAALKAALAAQSATPQGQSAFDVAPAAAPAAAGQPSPWAPA